MKLTTDPVCVILAGGHGNRMASRDLHKVCFPIAGKPAIVRAIDTYKEAGLRRFVVVVGHLAEQVMETVASAHPDVTFVYQSDPRGTGHAAQVAVQALDSEGFDGDLLLVMGDKITIPGVVAGLLNKFAAGRPDMLITALPKDHLTTSGRVVKDSDGNPVGIVEMDDIARDRRSGEGIRVGGLTMSAEQVEDTGDSVNASLYAFRFSALHEALADLGADNAQAEIYLTDAAAYLAQNGRRIDVYAVNEPQDLMGFNTPAELIAVEEVVRAREGIPRVSVSADASLDGRHLRTAEQWLEVLGSNSADLRENLRGLYGADAGLIEERRTAMFELAKNAAATLGLERPMVLCRAPGRINLMGRHVDHRGGYVNVMAIGREMLLAAAPRNDDVVTLRNLDPGAFPPSEFRIGELLARASWTDWMDFIESSTVRGELEAARGDWSHYARAALMRLQHEARDHRLTGMDFIVSGNIPVGAGLSSSSAVVVAFAQAAIALNGLDIGPRDFVDLCGEGEWFVGMKGGSADHAAISTGKVGHLSRIGFFPFRLEGQTLFPPGLELVVADSGQKAPKSGAAKDEYNQRVACYDIAMLLLKQDWPAAAGVQHLRDVAPDRLGLSASEIYRAVSRLPDQPDREQIRQLLRPESQPELDRIFATHNDLGGYDLRGVALYGVAECLRSEGFADLVERGDLDGIGAMMRASHNGDRLVRVPIGGPSEPYVVRTDGSALDRLADTNADLAKQPGRYACSTRAIDQLVDIANATPGVVGSQLAGGGLGGCMMVLVRSEARDAVMERLVNEATECDPRVFVCQPVAGACLLEV